MLDPAVNHTISAATHHSKIDTNVYEGEPFQLQHHAACGLAEPQLGEQQAGRQGDRHPTMDQHARWQPKALSVVALADILVQVAVRS